MSMEGSITSTCNKFEVYITVFPESKLLVTNSVFTSTALEMNTSVLLSGFVKPRSRN